jgi:hypothetical protein
MMLATNENPELKLDNTVAGERSAPPHGAVASTPAESNAPPLVELPTKRELLDDALRTNSNRSDREIAREIGVDHKTVGAARARLGLPSPLGNSPPVSPVASPGKEISLGEATNKAVAMIASLTKPAEPEFDPFTANGEDLVIPHQPAVAVYENPFGAVVIRQARGGEDDDPVILIRPEHVEKLIARLRFVAKQAQE